MLQNIKLMKSIAWTSSWIRLLRQAVSELLKNPTLKWTSASISLLNMKANLSCTVVFVAYTNQRNNISLLKS